MKALDKVSDQLRAPAALPRKKSLGNRLSRTMGVLQSLSGRLKKRIISQETKYGSLIVLLIAQSLFRLRKQPGYIFVLSDTARVTDLFQTRIVTAKAVHVRVSRGKDKSVAPPINPRALEAVRAISV